MHSDAANPASHKYLAHQLALLYVSKQTEPLHDKTNKITVCPAKTQISLGIRQSDQSLCCPQEEKLGP